MIYKATEEEVKNFCEYTKDPGKIHNSEEMKKLGKKAAVPAMYLMFRDISNLPDPREAKTVSFGMNKIHSVGDSLTLIYQSRPRVDEIIGYEKVEFGSRGPEGEISYELSLSDDLMEDSSYLKEDHFMDIEICRRSVNDLRKLFKPKNDLVKTLSLMTSASGVMLAAIKYPANEHEQEIKDLMEKNNLLPVYSGFIYTFPEGLKPTNSTNASYSVTFQDKTQEGIKSKQKEAFAKVICETDDLEFNAYFDFKLVPEKVIIRKGLEKLE